MLKHGFHSNHTGINPDCRLLNGADLSSDDLAIGERYLFGDACNCPGREFDISHAHSVAKAIYASGRFKYPHLWDKARKYAESEECRTFEKLSSLGSGAASGSAKPVVNPNRFQAFKVNLSTHAERREYHTGLTFEQARCPKTFPLGRLHDDKGPYMWTYSLMDDYPGGVRR